MNHRDPATFEFNDDELRQIQEHMERQSSKLVDMNTNLCTDTLTVPGQNFALVSIVSDRSPQKSERCCIKIRGVFSTVQEANHHAQRLSQTDPNFDILVVSMYEWLMVPPELDKIDDQVYNDEHLNELISEYRKVQERTNIEFQLRKDALKMGTNGKGKEI